MKRDFELNMDISYKDKNNFDEWGCACLYDDEKGLGVDYNYCIEDGENYCALYLIEYQSNDEVYHTDYDCFEHYEIKWERADWADLLEKAMNEFLDKKILERE